ncbi:hypothetical protein EQ500_08035 [Lactobacillus sp. XV13L]|nr:hypothetical protein [Lactobacillus sp. XV13L]
MHAKSTLQTISRLESLHVNANELSNCLTAICYQRLLPTNGELSCLMDIASGTLLQDNIAQKIRGNYVDWVDNLVALRKRGAISAQVFEQFQEG